MARLESQAVAGYFPTPRRLLASLASLISWEARDGWKKPSYFLFDPCAGDGEAIAALRDEWWEDGEGHPVAACEMEATRAGDLRSNLRFSDQVLSSDAFLVTWRETDTGASLLFLNPPYDQDSDYGRLEERFLERFKDALAPGGALMFLVPVTSLAASAVTLGKCFGEHRVWRFPDPEFADFKQCVLLARRLPALPGDGGAAARRIERWAKAPEKLPALPERCDDPLEMAAGDFGLHLTAAAFDHRASVAAYRPWQGLPMGTDLELGDLIGRAFPTAVPPKPAHVALALAAGHFNGHRIEPNEPSRFPPLLLKGVYTRRFEEVELKTNSKGEVTGSVQVEQPKLHLRALRLDTYRFFEPQPGTVPTGTDRLDRFNAADLLTSYSRSLTRLMARQFPSLHSPARASAQIELPELARRPYECQRHAIQAALKLLSRGQNPQLVAEVGTGKTTMSLFVAAALSSEHHVETCAELRRAGFDPSRLPVVRRTLVLCPPHLLKSWSDQAAAVWPSARVQIVREIADLHASAEIFVLSREAAKLGHGYRGLAGRCPRCGAPIPEDPETNARRRLRCQAVHREPWNPWAQLAEELAAALLPVASKEPLVLRLVGRWPKLAAHPERALSALDPARLRSIASAVFAETSALLRSESTGYAFQSTSVRILVDLARGLGVEEEAARALESLASNARPGVWSPLTYAREAAIKLRSGESPADRGRHLLAALKAMAEVASWRKVPSYELSRRRQPTNRDPEVCGEPLYQATPEPRRYPLARYVARYLPKRFDLLVLDEVHEFSNQGTAQQKAAHRLVELGMPALALTGSVMGGYSSSLFANMWSLDRDFRREFGRDEKSAFIARYGFRKVLVTEKDGKGDAKSPVDFGTRSDREEANVRFLGEAPGILPLFLLRHLLPSAVIVHKDDLETELPPMREHPVPIVPETDLDQAIVDEYIRLMELLRYRIRKDMFSPLAGKLWGALLELPTYLDRCTEDLGPFELRYPENCECAGQLIAQAHLFPASIRTPKERWLLGTVRQGLRDRRKVLVFLRHTGSAALPKRLLRLLRDETRARAAWLDARRVPTHRREAWIDEHVIDRDVDVLLVNPNAVRTGLNNLIGFSIAVWHQLDYDARTYRQANGRLHRIGQENEVDVYFPFAQATAQEIALRLVAQKVTASLQVDGLSVQGALEAAGAGEDSRAALATTIGQAIYEELRAA